MEEIKEIKEMHLENLEAGEKILPGDNNQISGKQFMFAIICFIQAAILYFSVVSRYTNRNNLTVILQLVSFFVYIPLVFIFYYLLTKFPDKNLVEICESVFGNLAGKIISIAFLCFYLFSAAVNLNEVSDFVGKYMLPKMSRTIIAFVLIIAAAWCAYSGVKAFTKFCGALVVFVGLILIILAIFSKDYVDIKNLIPVLGKTSGQSMRGIGIGSVLNYGDIFLLLMLSPKVSRKKRALKKRHIAGGYLFGGLALISFGIINTAVLGNLISYFTYPSFEVMRVVSIWDSINRFEMIFVMAVIFLICFKLGVAVYGITKGIGSLVKIENTKKLTLVVSALIFSFSVSVIKGVVGDIFLSENFSFDFLPWFIFGIVFPIVILFGSLIRDKNRDKREEEKI